MKKIILSIGVALFVTTYIFCNQITKIPCAPQFTNNITTFINSLDDFNLTKSSYGAWTQKINNVLETINCADLFLINENKSTTIIVYYSETNFVAEKFYLESVIPTYAGGLPPTNTTYQTDFTVLSRCDYGTASKHTAVDLLSTNVVIIVSLSNDDGDSSQDMIQMIKKVETMRDAMNAETQ